MRRVRRFLSAVPLLLLVLALAACGSTGAASNGGSVHVVAAENFWGSIAAQLGGGHATVLSIIRNPAVDPHSYEPSAGDARALAGAQLVIINGIGYDPWAPRLLAANPTPGRIVLNVGDLLGFKEGDNPHRWYDPVSVDAVARQITADLIKLAPAHATALRNQLTRLRSHGLGTYHRLIATIAGRYAGTPVGASESIFAALAPALRLDLITPRGLMDATSEGTEPGAQDLVAAQQQITGHRISVWIYNSQNATPEVQHLNALARAAGIPVVSITETLDPPSASFQQWQVAQLQRLEAALHQATGR